MKFSFISKLLAVFTFLAVILVITDAAKAQENKAEFVVGQKTYVVDGQTEQMDVAPFIDENGRTAVPLRFLALAVGILEKDIKWCEKEQTVSLTKGGTTVDMTVGKTALSINGKVAGYMDTSPVLRGGRVFLPARYVAEAFGHALRWDQAARKVYIGSEGSSTGLSLKSSPPETSPSKNDKISSTSETTKPPGGRTIQVDPEKVIAEYKYDGGYMVGVEGKYWYLSVAGNPMSGYTPVRLIITDPDTGKRRQYDPSGAEWKQDPVVVRFGLAAHIEGVIRDLEREKTLKPIQQWQQQQLEKLNQELREQERERQRQLIEDRRRMEEWKRQQEMERLIKPPVTQPYTPPTYTPTVPYTPPTYSPAQPWSPGGRW